MYTFWELSTDSAIKSKLLIIQCIMLAFLLAPKFKRKKVEQPSSGKKHTTTAKAGKLVPEDAHLQKPTSALIAQNTTNFGKALRSKITTAFEPMMLSPKPEQVSSPARQ